jgi:monovalent cation:H+ antiporter-2, CPA2 family
VKAAMILGLSRLFRVSLPAAIETALLLGPAGEFAFVAIGLASALGMLTPSVTSFTLAVVSLSMILIPLLALLAQRIRARFEAAKVPDPALTTVPVAQVKHAIVVGYGRVGRDVALLLERHKVPYTAIDHSAAAVVAGRGRGGDVYFGDATSPEFLKSCGLMEAAGVIVTIHTQAMIDEIVRVVRRLRPEILVVARAKDAAHARHLYSEGVTDAVPETVEASLQLSEAALVGLGIPTGPVIASIHERRDEVRLELQAAAKAAGRDEMRGLRGKAPAPVVAPVGSGNPRS